MNTYIFNLETTKIELHFEKANYDALTDAQRRELKSAFLWSRTGQCWVSRAKEPNLWRAKEVAKKLGFTEEQREGERLTYGEQLERQVERAEARADRYEGYADNAAKRGAERQKVFDSVRGDIAFFTQPNINTSAGRAFTRQREKMFERYHKGFEEYRKSDYFKDRAQTARETASQAQFDNPAYLDRRIKECKKEIRDREKNVVYYENILNAVENGEEKKWHDGEVVTIEKVTSLLEYQLELVEKAMDKQAYLENRLEELGGLRFSKDNIKIGYTVLIKRWGNCEVIKTGPVNFGFKTARGSQLQAAYAEIDEIIKAEEKKRSPHPFKAGETFTAEKVEYAKETDKYGIITTKANRSKIVYEITKASDTTIQLRPVGTDEKPITRKPVKTYSGKWRFSIDDTYGNTFYKEEGGCP